MRLVLQGLASATATAAVREALPELGPTTRVCFVSYAEDDVPAGTVFDGVSSASESDRIEPTVARLVGVTQQFGRPFDGIPRGWKTICAFDFPEWIPDRISGLPVVDAWSQEDGAILWKRR